MALVSKDTSKTKRPYPDLATPAGYPPPPGAPGAAPPPTSPATPPPPGPPPGPTATGMKLQTPYPPPPGAGTGPALAYVPPDSPGSGTTAPPPGPTSTTTGGPGAAPGAPPPPPPTGAPPPAAPGAITAQSLHETIDSTVAVAQYQQWIDMGLLDPGCPPNRPFKYERSGVGTARCAEKPVDCPPGMMAHGAGQCIGEGSAPGGGGSGGSGGGGFGSPGDVSGQASTLWDEIMGLQSRYSPEVMQRLIGGAKSRGAAAGKRSAEAANLDAIRRGLGRSGDAGLMADEAQRGTEGSIVNSAVQHYTSEKIKGDAEDRIHKLTAMQNWINSARQHIQAMTATANQKQIALANLKLMEDRLKQELEMQQRQFDFQMAYGAQAGMGY